MNATPMDRAGMRRPSLRSYLVGFFLSIILTVLAFGLVMVGTQISRIVVIVAILSAAGVQMLVHLHCFLHLDTSSSMRWNVMALVCTLLIIILFVGGSLWIMGNLNARMM